MAKLGAVPPRARVSTFLCWVIHQTLPRPARRVWGPDYSPPRLTHLLTYNMSTYFNFTDEEGKFNEDQCHMYSTIHHIPCPVRGQCHSTLSGTSVPKALRLPPFVVATHVPVYPAPFRIAPPTPNGLRISGVACN